MSQHKLTAKEWQHFSSQISFSKETVEQLSKLYIIIHEKVKSSIKNSVIDPKKSFSSQAQHHIEFIKKILEKINDTKNDQYLAQIERDLLAKYEKNFLSLLNQIEIMLKIQYSQSNLNFNSLKSVRPQKRQKHDLKSQVVQSTKRITRAKSGYKTRRQSPQVNTNQTAYKTKKQTSNIDSFLPTNVNAITERKTTKFQIDNESDFGAAFSQKRQALGSKIQNSMSKTSNGLGISFQKKYQDNYLEMYLNERKQFADLIFNQEVYNQIIEQNEQKSKELVRSDSNSPSKILKMEEVNTKLFPQFQIKTKFMKPGVKSKISNLITQIKKELLQVYFAQNIGTLKAANEAEKQKLTDKKKSSISALNTRSQSFSSINRRNSLETIQQGYENKLTKQIQGVNFAKTQYLMSYNNSPSKMNKVQSVHLLNKKQIFGPRAKKSFINPNPKPFYETQKWNSKIEKKYENRIMTKLLHAKI